LNLDEVNDIDAVTLEEPLINSDPNSNQNEMRSKTLYRKGKKTVRRYVSSFLGIYTDQSGSCCNIFQGMSLMFFVGAFLGIVLPKDADLPTPAYRSLSSIIGYTYFVCWSVSFYPQIITNYQLKSVDGLSIDSQVMAVLNNLCYTIYNVEFFWDRGIREEYKAQHGDNAEITIQSNDVAFSLHALLMSLILVSQIAYYQGLSISSLSTVTISLVTGVSTLCIIYVLGIMLQRPGFLWINFFYILAFIKLAFTICFYVPQILLNRKRQSTEGWNIWNVILDFSGGLLSLLQIVGDSIDMHDFTGITGNWAKFLLGCISLFFDCYFFLQHYVFYRHNRTLDDSTHAKMPITMLVDFYENQELV